MAIIFLVACLGGVFFLFSLEYGEPTTEIFVAELLGIWTTPSSDETGGYNLYNTRLKRNEDVLTCRLAFILEPSAYQLEIVRSYEFTVTRTRSRCFINNLTVIDE